MNSESNKKNDGRKKNGGVRPGAGRKKGSTNRYSSKDLLEALSTVANGQEYVDQLAEDYWAARFGDDKTLAHKYHHLISSKVFADHHTVEIDDTTAAESRSHAFLRALETIGNIAVGQDQDNSTDDK